MIEYEEITQYGHKRKFIRDLEMAEAFFLLTGRKTLKDEDIENLIKLGVIIQAKKNV
jgi:hypothetical protein